MTSEPPRNFVLGNLVVVLAALGLSQVVVWWFASDRGWGSLTLVGGVIAAYSLDRFLDAPSTRRRRILARFGPPLAIGAALVLTGLWLVPAHLPLAAVLALLAGPYVPLKRVLPKSVLTASGWTLAVVWLPGTPIPSLRAGLPVAACIFLIVGANAILCDALDVDEDRQRGIRGLGPWLGAARASRIASVLAISGAVLSFTLGPWPLAAAAAPLALAGLSLTPPHQREWRRTLFDLALVIPGVVAAFLPPR